MCCCGRYYDGPVRQSSWTRVKRKSNETEQCRLSMTTLKVRVICRWSEMYISPPKNAVISHVALNSIQHLLASYIFRTCGFSACVQLFVLVRIAVQYSTGNWSHVAAAAQCTRHGNIMVTLRVGRIKSEVNRIRHSSFACLCSSVS